MIEVLPDWLNNLSIDDKALLECFHLLHGIADQRLRKSAMFELYREKRTHQIYQENEILKKNINGI